MNIRTVSGLALALLSIGAQSSLSCSEAKQVYDCALICDSYATCIDESVDRFDCTTACEGQGEHDSDFAKQASQCELCIDDQSCTSAAAQCSRSCAIVIDKSS